jgi:hypothetical protein
MIARVRIAPVERWCQLSKNILKSRGFTPEEIAVGEEIIIDPSSMIESDGERLWTAKETDTVQFDRSEDRLALVCEHMLEMD